MKNWITFHKKTVLNFMFAASCALALPGTLMPMAMGDPRTMPAKNGASAMPDLSPEQMEELQQELAKINDEMQAFVKTLPPEKQQEIAELEEAINQMSDDELEQLFEQLFTDPNFLNELEQMTAQPQQPEATEPEPVYQPTAKPVEKPIEKPKIEKNRTEIAAQMIKSLSDTTESFLAKIDTVPEIDDVVQNWIKKHQLRGWKHNVSWSTIKSQIDLFNQKLKKMLVKEPGTNEYRFLPDLINDESVYNNLAHMESVLKLNVPKIEVTVFGLKKLSKESKASMRAALNKYAEGMSDLQLIPSLNIIIEKHEPIAKQMRDKEEALSKQAFEESKKQRTEKSMVIAGKPEQRPSAASSSYPDYSYYPSSGYQPSYRPGYAPSSAPEHSGLGGEKQGGVGSGAGKGGAAGTSGKTDDDKDKGDKDKGKDSDKDKNKDKGKGKDKDKKPKSGSLQEKLNKVEKKLKEADKASNDPLLVHMSKHISAPGLAPKNLGAILQESISKINDATAAVNDLGKSLSDEPEKTQKEYKGKVRSAYNRQINLLDIDRQLTHIKKNWPKAQYRHGINEAKRNAYGINFDAPVDAMRTQMDASDMADEPDNLMVDDEAMSDDIAEAARQAQAAGLPHDIPAPAKVTATKKPVVKAPEAHAPVAPAAPIQLEEDDAIKKHQTPQSIYDAMAALNQAIEKLAK